MATSQETSRAVVSLADHEVRALTEKMSVLPDVGWASGAPGLYLIVSESGATYRVDADAGRCSCPSQFYRGGPCKHTARVAYATRQREIPDWVNQDRVDPRLGQHIHEEGQR